MKKTIWIIKNCLICKKQFKRCVVRVKADDAKYCSRYCKNFSMKGNKLGLGYRFSDTMKDHLSKIQKGAWNHNWKGGISSINNNIRSSAKYKNWRKSVFKRDNYTCQLCGDNRGGNLNADHILPFSLFIELRFELLNGRTLCENCHKTTDSYLNNQIKREDYCA